MGPELNICIIALSLWQVTGFLQISNNQRNKWSSQLFQQRLRVWDDVFSLANCDVIDAQAREGGLGHTVFHRRSSAPRTAVEQAIESVLQSLEDMSPLVEYWWRDEWMSLESHRDIDERRGQQQPEVPLLVPKNAHVLYLQVGEGVRGPTIVLHDREDRADSTGNLIAAPVGQQQFDKISMVPAVSGRLLRFDGSFMHAVPRPALAYLDPEEGGSNLELWTRRRPHDDTDPELTVYRRSVLLFNTWREGNESPLDVDVEAPMGTATMHEARPDQQPLSCNALEQWQQHNSCDQPKPQLSAEESRQIHLKIGLLGDNRRRERIERYLHLDAPYAVKDALESDARKPQTFYVTEQM